MSRALLVTGGTGTLGRALVAEALKSGVYERVVAFSRDEFKQALYPSALTVDPRLRLFLGDVRDGERLRRAMVGITDVVHAAALKWIAVGAYNADEIVKTNVLGTMRVIQAAVEARVQRVLLISSDKACHPANVYGASKLMAEQYAVQANSFAFPPGTRISAVRYGNVLWSRGSVAHRWAAAQLIGDPLILTDRRMTRFGILRSQAVAFVRQALEIMRGGEVFVPLLASFRLLDVAEALKNRYREAREPLNLQVTGLRPGGEKLHEMLLTPEESLRTVLTEDRYVIEPVARSWDRAPWTGEPVPEGWEYTSDKNAAWMSQQDLIASFDEMDAGIPNA